MFKVSATHGEWIILPYMQLLATLIVISGTAEVEGFSGNLDKYSTWYVLPGSTLKLRNVSKDKEELIVFIANPVH